MAGDARASAARLEAIVLLNVSLYAACFMAQQPVQPYIVESLSSDARTAFTSLRTFIAALQLVGSLLSGWLVDRYGARNVFLLAFLASAASYAITACATSLPLLFLAQVPTVFQHAVLAARAYVTSMLPAGPARADALGRVAFAYGVGMLVGPVLGGLLAQAALAYAAAAATVGSLLSIALVWIFLPDAAAAAVTSHKNDAVVDGSGGSGGAIGAGAVGYGALLSTPKMLSALGVKALFTLASSVLQSGVALLATEHYRLGVAANGTILAAVAAFSIIGSVGIVPYLNRAFRASPGARVTPLCVTAAAAFAAALAAFSVTSTHLQLLLLTPFLAIPQVVFETLNTALLCDLVETSLHGSLHAAVMAMSSGVRVASPAIAAVLVSGAGAWSIGMTTSAVSLLVAGLLYAGVGTAEA